jgi:Domain of unknown function (DUF4349)
MDRTRLPRRLSAAAALVVAVITGLVVTGRAYRMESETVDEAAARLAALAVREARPRASGVAGEALAAMFEAHRLVRTAALSIEVASYPDAAEKAVAIAQAHGGYLADSRVARDAGGRQRGTLTVRVPAGRFDAAFRELKALGRVEAANLETRDVTKEYADTSARVAAKREARQRLTDILRTRTADLADLVSAEKELSRLLEEIEALEGQRLFYERQTALSTIVVDLAEPAAFLRDSALAPLSKALRDALPLLAGSVAAMVYAAAAALPWAIAALVIWKMRRKTGARLGLSAARFAGQPK